MRALHQRLAVAAARSPEAVALVQGERRTTYRELLEGARRMAAVLRGLGVGPGDRVALVLENGADYVIAWYGVVSAGAVVVALHPGARARELATCIGHCGARVVIADAGHPELAAVMAGDPELRLLSMGAPGPADDRVLAWEQAARGAAPADMAGGEPGQLATLIYTSGTTGSPKGVMLSHGNLAANVDSILGYLELTAADRALCVLGFNYSYGSSVLHTHLSIGASIILENSLVYPAKVLERLVAERATGLAGVPSTFALLLKRAPLASYDLSSLRYLTQAGGAMPPAHIRQLRQAIPRARLFVMYGQTEATARLTFLPPDRLDEKLGSVGVAIPGVSIQVQDAHGQPLPAREQGEVCARGDNVMLGYWRDDAATATVLRDGWLHTGDLGFVDEEGFLYLHGRRSDMIKSGAHRISPLEIEEVVARIEGVAECAAVGVADEMLGQVVKVVVVPRPGAAIDTLEIQRHCRENLTSHKVPRLVELAAELPRTTSGKVQRHLLGN